MPGFGHPVHKPLDPRTERILELADERGVSRAHVARAREFHDAMEEVYGKPLTMNVSLPIAAVMLDLGYSSADVSAVPHPRPHGGPACASRRGAATPGRPADGKDGGERSRTSADVEARPWDEQLALDDASYREQLVYLLERSAFYREKLGLASPEEAGGLADIAQLPLTEKDEVRATCMPDNPIGTHLCAAPSELVRIYSTSGTTGAPSYVPLTAGDLDNWVTTSARSYAASGIAAGQRIVTTYNAGPFAAGAALPAFDRIGLCHIPFGTGNTERLLTAIERLGPRWPCSRPPTRPISSRPPNEASTSRGRASSACSWRVSPAAARRRSGRSSKPAGERR